MRLKEYEGKKLLDEYGIEVPRSILIDESNISEFSKKIKFLHTDEVVVKAQILSGGRRKAGLVVIVPRENAEKSAITLLNKSYAGLKIKELLVEEKINIAKEYYISITIDRQKKSPILLFSKKGGIDVEKMSKTEKVCRLNFSRSDFNSLQKKVESCKEMPEKIWKLLKPMYNLFVDQDTTLIEINPLVITKENDIIAADAKIIIDDNAIFRQKEFLKRKDEQLNEAEQKAADYGLQYVDLNGDIAVIGNGAGLVMATLDILAHFGRQASCFLDVGGGASIEVMENAIEVALMKNPKGIIINVFGGITHCDDIAQGIVNFKNEKGIHVPIAVRMIGTGELKARTLLKANFIYAHDSMEECIKRIVELT